METDDDLAPAPEYEFNMNESNTHWPDNRQSMASSMIAMNNEDMSLQFTPSDVTDVNNNIGDVIPNHIQKGEYSYHASDKIKNYWAGPSYWKVPPNRHLVRIDGVKKKSKSRQKIQQEKAAFSLSELTDDSDSEDECFITTNSKEAKKIKKCNYRNFDPKTLPLKSDIPRDLFDSYVYCPSFNFQRTCSPIETQDTDSNDTQENNAENDYSVSKFSTSFRNLLIKYSCYEKMCPISFMSWCFTST